MNYFFKFCMDGWYIQNKNSLQALVIHYFITAPPYPSNLRIVYYATRERSEWFSKSNIIDTRAVGKAGKFYESKPLAVLSHIVAYYGTFCFIENWKKSSVYQTSKRCLSKSILTSNHLLLEIFTPSIETSLPAPQFRISHPQK